jgi:hypothetical protein
MPKDYFGLFAHRKDMRKCKYPKTKPKRRQKSVFVGACRTAEELVEKVASRRRRSETSATLRVLLELGHFGEVKLADLHGRNHHVKRFFPAGAHRFSHRLNVVQHLNQALVKTEVANP